MHCFFEFGHLFVDLVVQRFFLCHIVSAQGWLCVGGRLSLFVGFQRPIRHRGERRRLRERKNSVGLLGVAFNLNCPPHCVIRLTILYTYKGYESALTKS